MNEETIIEKRPVINGQGESKKGSAGWKQVTLGGVSGIFMGAGMMYAGQAVAATPSEGDAGEDTGNAALADGQQAEAATGTSLPVAQMHNDLSFGEAFAAARAEVGSGGVFIWHGGIYNTYTAEEWSAMTQEQKNDFAHQVNPAVPAYRVSAPTDDHPDVEVQSADDAAVHTASDTPDVQMVEQQIAHNFDMGDDVHIVGYAEADGHLVVGYDTTGDGQADIAIIDVDGNLRPSDADVIMDNKGNMATLGELASAQDPNIAAADEMQGIAGEAPADFDCPVIEI